MHSGCIDITPSTLFFCLCYYTYTKLCRNTPSRNSILWYGSLPGPNLYTNGQIRPRLALRVVYYTRTLTIQHSDFIIDYALLSVAILYGGVVFLYKMWLDELYRESWLPHAASANYYQLVLAQLSRCHFLLMLAVKCYLTMHTGAETTLSKTIREVY